MVTLWDKTFARATKSRHRKGELQEPLGLTLVADLYLPKNRGNARLAAICRGRPLWRSEGAVERSLCPNPLAERGFVTWRLTLPPAKAAANHAVMWPPRHQHRRLSVPPSEFPRSATGGGPYQSYRPVGHLRLGWHGPQCRRHGYARVKAVATSVMYDMSRAMGHGVGDGGSLHHCRSPRHIETPERTTLARRRSDSLPIAITRSLCRPEG